MNYNFLQFPTINQENNTRDREFEMHRAGSVLEFKEKGKFEETEVECANW